MQISKETIDALQSKFPEFEEACHSFFKGELPPAKYKGISGRFGSYAEKGGKSAMLRLRFPGGTISRDHMRFLHDVIENIILRWLILRQAKHFSCIILTEIRRCLFTKIVLPTAFIVTAAVVTIRET